MKTLIYTVAIGTLGCLALAGQTNVLTYHNDIGRTGQNVTETILTPVNVTTATFGKRLTLNLDGQVLAQPLYMSGLSVNGVVRRVLFVATAHDSVYAFDALTGAQLWKATMLDAAHGAAPGAIPDPVSTTGCGDINGLGGGAPEHGIIGTPVIDQATGTMYVVSKTFEGTYPVLRLHALDVTTGNEKLNGPVVMAATVPGTGTGSTNGLLTFDPKWENQRPALLLVNGVVYAGFGGHCDFGPFHGWILGYNATTLAQTAAYATTPNGGQSGIWINGALAADVQGGTARLFAVTGNGSFDATQPYTNAMSYSNAMQRFTAAATGGLTVSDAFTPLNNASLTAGDLDFGAGGPMLLPDQPGAIPHLLVQLGKSGPMFVMNRENLGGYSPTTNNVVQEISAGRLWGSPAYWNGSVYVWPYQGRLSRYPLTNGTLPSTPSDVSVQRQFDWLGTTPSISSNGTQAGIVWSIDYSQNPQVVYAHNAANVSQLLWSSAQNTVRDGAGSQQKFAVPTVADGRVFVAAVNQVMIYGLLEGDFSLSAPATLSVHQGASQTTAITVTPADGFSGTVAFTASNLPTGVTAAFATNTLTLTASPSVVPGTYPVLITGVSGALSRSATVSVTVTAAPDFGLGATPSSVTVVAGGTATSQIAVSALNGFSGAVTFSVGELPAGVTAAFAPASASTLATLTFSAIANAVPTAATVTITGTANGLTRTTTLNLAVAGAPNFGLGATPSSVSVVAGNTATSQVAISAQNGFAGTVAFSAAGLPAGVTANFSPGSSTTASTVTFTTLTTATASTSAVIITGIGTSGTGDVLSRTITLTLTVLPAPDFGLGATPSAVNVVAGSSAVSQIAVLAQNGFTGPVAFSASGLPAGVSASFSASSSTAGTTVTFAAGANAATATGTVTITGISGTLTRTTAIELALAAAPDFALSATPPSVEVLPGNGVSSLVIVAPINGFSGAVAFSASGLPAGVTASFTRLTTEITVTFTAAANALPGSTPITIIGTFTGTGGALTRTVNVNLTVAVPPDFSLAATPTLVNVLAGSTASGQIAVTPQNGFTGAVTLSATGLPTGVTATFAPATTTKASTVTFSAAANSAPTTATITVKGTAGTLTHMTILNLVVAGAPSFGVTASPSLVNLVAGNTTVSQVAITPQNGFTGAVTLSAAGLPAGVTASFAPATATTASTVTFIAAANAAAGAATVIITGTAGTLSSATTISLIVAPPPDFNLTATPSLVNVVAGATAASQIAVAALNGFTGEVSLSAAGLPAGVTASFAPATATTVSSVTFTAAASAAPAAATVIITGTAGTLTHMTTINLVVAGAPSFGVTATPALVSLVAGGTATSQLSVSAQNGFTGAVTLSAAGLPAGVTASFASATSASGSTVSFAAAANAAAGTAAITITGVSGALTSVATITLTVAAAPDFKLTATPSSVNLVAGSSGTSQIAISALNGFNGAVAFSANGLPAGVTVSFAPATSTSASTVTFSAAANAALGTGTVLITGTSGCANPHDEH